MKNQVKPASDFLRGFPFFRGWNLILVSARLAPMGADADLFPQPLCIQQLPTQYGIHETSP
ncbi:MAG: hypothetical protein CMJ65_04630 [Planctomycetaceae bacterium]|nr:hypothetical protein [Planctomycetaceae bacterium]